jgi:hypothetical protein
MAPETSGNGLFQAISCLLQSVGDIFPLRDGFWDVRKGDQKSTIVLVWGQDGRIDKVLHKSFL